MILALKNTLNMYISSLHIREIIRIGSISSEHIFDILCAPLVFIFLSLFICRYSQFPIRDSIVNTIWKMSFLMLFVYGCSDSTYFFIVVVVVWCISRFSCTSNIGRICITFRMNFIDSILNICIPNSIAAATQRTRI